MSPNESFRIFISYFFSLYLFLLLPSGIIYPSTIDHWRVIVGDNSLSHLSLEVHLLLKAFFCVFAAVQVLWILRAHD